MDNNRPSLDVEIAIIKTKLDAIFTALNDRFASFEKRVAELEAYTKAELERRVQREEIRPLVRFAWGAIGIVLAGVLYAVLGGVIR